MLLFEEEEYQVAKIKVFGVGGSGCNAVNTMIAGKLSGVEFVAANTDIQALGTTRAQVKLQLGAKLTKGLGAGIKPGNGTRGGPGGSGQNPGCNGRSRHGFYNGRNGRGNGYRRGPDHRGNQPRPRNSDRRGCDETLSPLRVLSGCSGPKMA